MLDLESFAVNRCYLGLAGQTQKKAESSAPTLTPPRVLLVALSAHSGITLGTTTLSSVILLPGRIGAIW
jgi:hypothetical protein